MLPNPDQAALDTDTYLGGQLGRYLFDAAANPPADGHRGDDLDRRQRL